jgi:LysR family transcriptional regulator, transcriptional activator for bauABCD operon
LAALQLFDDIDQFRDKVATATRQVTGRVTLVMVDNIVSVAEQQLSRALARFCRDYPHVDLMLSSSPGSIAERQVLEGGADLGISVLPRAMAALETIPLFREDVRLYCGRGHPLFDAPADGLTDDMLVKHRIVGPSASDDPAFAEWASGWRAGARAFAEALDARVLLALGGAFLAFLPPHYAKRFVDEGKLKMIGGQRFASANMFHVFFKKATRLSAAALHLPRIILDEFRDRAPRGDP